jgi:hypothetical protein
LKEVVHVSILRAVRWTSFSWGVEAHISVFGSENTVELVLEGGHAFEAGCDVGPDVVLEGVSREALSYGINDLAL